MIEYEHQNQDRSRYVTELKSGDVLEIDFIPEGYFFDGSLNLKTRNQAGDLMAMIRAEVFEKSDRKKDELLEVSLKVIESEVVADDDRQLGNLLLLGVWFMTEMGIERVRIGEVPIDAESDLMMEAVELLGSSPMEHFLADGKAALAGGLALEVDLAYTESDSDKGVVKAKINSADGTEGYLEALLWVRDVGVQLHIYKLQRLADIRWVEAEAAMRTNQEKMLSSAVEEVLRPALEAAGEEWLMDDLTTTLSYLVARYLRHNVLYEFDTFLYGSGIDDKKKIHFDEEVMYGQISEWLGF